MKCSEIKKNPITADDKKRGEDGLPSYLKVALCDRPVPDGDWGDHGPFRNLLESSMRSDRKKLRKLKKHMRLIMTENRPSCHWSLGTGLSEDITTQVYVLATKQWDSRGCLIFLLLGKHKSERRTNFIKTRQSFFLSE